MEFRNLKRQYGMLKSEIDSAIAGVINDGIFIGGKYVELFEQELAEYIGAKHCISCANGTDALTLALMAYGVGKDDAVFVPDFTYIATASAAAILGATPVFVDIDSQTYNIDPQCLEIAICKVIDDGSLIPKVIIPVDLFGLPADYTNIRAIAERYDLAVVEDGAQGFGGAIGNKKACSFGDISTTSFYPAKPLGCYGDGGAIITDDDEIAGLLKSFKINGASLHDKYDNWAVGMNSRLDALQAAILSVKLKAFLRYELSAVNQASEILHAGLSSLPQLQLPNIPENRCSAWAQYSILLPTTKARDELKENLKSNGIPTMIFYPKGLHQQKVFSKTTQTDEEFPNTLNIASRILSLPMHPYLEKGEMALIVKVIREFFN
jgi:dTDP-4-amino-4,6-dideoxygalactose transaminase